eukprot:8430642-Prorocentrum_lima.AAC.1
MTSSLVGSEMCIRDRHPARLYHSTRSRLPPCKLELLHHSPWQLAHSNNCLLYTSDAADDM